MVKKQPPQIVSLPLVVDHGRLTLHGHPAPVNLRIRDKRRAAQNDEQQRNALRRDQRAVDNAFRDAAQKREEILQRLRRLRGKFLRRKLVAVEIARIVKVPVVDRQGFFVDRPLDRPLDLLFFPPEVKILVHRVEQIERQREQKVSGPSKMPLQTAFPLRSFRSPPAPASRKNTPPPAQTAPMR